MKALSFLFVCGLVLAQPTPEKLTGPNYLGDRDKINRNFNALTTVTWPTTSLTAPGTNRGYLPVISTYTITKVAANGTLSAGTYTSGITATGSTGQTCALTTFNGGGSAATATVALTGTNTIAGGTALVATASGSGFSSAPTSATAGNGTATCSGTATVSTTIAGSCQSANGCFRVTGIATDLAATNAATLAIPFLAAPAKAIEVGPIQLKTTSACTGPATAVVSDVGTANSASFFKTSLTHDLKTTAYTNITPTNQGNDLATAQNWTVTITTDGGGGGMNKDIVAGCAFTVSLPWALRP